MTVTLSPAGLALSDEFQAYLLKYRPQCLSSPLWDVVRPDVLDLVARCKPKFHKEIAMLAGSLCRLLAEFAGQVDEPSVATLLTRLNVDALLTRLQLEGMPDGPGGSTRSGSADSCGRTRAPRSPSRRPGASRASSSRTATPSSSSSSAASTSAPHQSARPV